MKKYRGIIGYIDDSIKRLREYADSKTEEEIQAEFQRRHDESKRRHEEAEKKEQENTQ